jgi:DNA-binding PadR family transcriptional regulator
VYEFLILAQLSRRPQHGYMIVKILDHIIGPFQRVQSGALYPVLGRLEEEGLIQAVESEIASEGHKRKVYAITDSGRARLHDLVMDTEHHLSEYDQLFAQKVGLFSQLLPEERLYLSRHYAVYAQQNIDHLERKRREFIAAAPEHLSREQVDDILTIMEHRIAYWETERGWAERLIVRQYTAKETV